VDKKMISAVFCFRKKMWSSVTAAGTENGPAPPSRSKHSATLLAGHVYLLGGRNGNLPLKDLWRYSLGELLNFCACITARTYNIARITLITASLNLRIRLSAMRREHKKIPIIFENDTAVFRVAPSTRYNINVVSDQRTPSHLLMHPPGRGCATEFERGSV